ncbi:aminotransferase class V-fold PLP-dependent enzyme [Streptomyces sp. NPDC006733]|uniref:aminotransferase class V-fold PLP-dependent enzyme n=1 Tax=Streptomyces sp. NPDC006733 TaxID=3155460 RepID=UPI0033EB017E
MTGDDRPAPAPTGRDAATGGTADGIPADTAEGLPAGPGADAGAPRAYLDHAGLGLLRAPALAAMRRALDEVYPHGSARMGRIFPARTAARASAARLLECSPDEVALVPNTSTGLHLVADGLHWVPGDEVVVFDRDFPANVHPWRALVARAGVRLRWVPMRRGGYETDDIAAAITPSTRLIAASHVNFATGFRLDLDQLCALAAPVGALVCVDAVQGLGALPLSTARTPVDFVAAGAHKWLGGPPGTGLFYCRAERLPLLRSVPAGWFGFDGANDMLSKGPGHFRYDLPLRSGTGRVEGGMYDVLGMVGLAAALDELAGVGVEAVVQRLGILTGRLREGLASLGYQVVSPARDGARSGIVSCTDPRRDGGQWVQELIARGIHVSYPDGMIRISPHYWTTDAEVELLLDALAVPSAGPRIRR